ncbi:MAG: FG-GAP-like repeat-containing protein [Planctomycetota bacterium]
MPSFLRASLLLVAFTHPAADQFDGTENPVSSIASGAFSVFAADLDGDGDADLLSASSFDDVIAWYENTDGSGAFGPRQLISFTADNATAVAAADLDGDGDLDVLSTSSGDDKVAWYENTDGLGAFGPQQLISSTADGAFAVAAADVDGDGDLDVVAGSFSDDTIAWFENTDGLATFGPGQTITTAADAFQSLRATDLDGDGDLDLLSASINDDKIAWYPNADGAGSFGAQAVITDAVDFAQTVTSADVDGDGDQDAVAGWFNDGIAWFENTDGAGGFGPLQVISTALDGVEAVGTADLDGDGDADVVSSSANDDRVAWYRNGGAGDFGPQQTVTTAADFAQIAVAADLDGDGDLDLASASFFDDKIAWYENQLCAATAAAAEVVRLGDPPNPFALLPGVTSGPVLCETWDPVVDHTSFLPTATIDTLAVALAPLNFPFPPNGTILCDYFTFGGTLLLSSPPGVPFTVPIPNQCNLVGATLCAQALSIDGAVTRYTNALDITIGTH